MSKSIAERLREARENAQLTEVELANKIGSSRSLISHIEAGFKIPSLNVTRELSKALGVSIDYLVGLTDNPEIAR